MDFFPQEGSMVFFKFKKIVLLVVEKKHLTKLGIKKILEIHNEINDDRKRKYSDEEILSLIPN